jgi:hypothetical protein
VPSRGIDRHAGDGVGRLAEVGRIGDLRGKLSRARRQRHADDGNVYVAGTTESTDFPVVGDVVQGTAPGGGGDGSLAKFDRAGRLVRATYFGGA